MARIQAIRGTKDLLGSELARWRGMEERVRAAAERAGYEEIRTPLFESTDLFSRSIGTETDIVQKEMYTFTDRKGRSLTLRPEGTASVVRAYLENNLARERPIAKFYYIGPMFRYERPQKGRYRQFHQFGTEVLGSDDPFYDAETIGIFHAILRSLGLDDLVVRLGSVGDEECRPAYTAKLTAFLRDRRDRLSEISRERLERNPLRVLDSKEEEDRAVLVEAPSILEDLCPACRDHIGAVRRALEAGKIAYALDEGLVRGLDYYTRTVFEIHHEKLGAQSALGGGGRYDRLVEELGGPRTAGVGFSAGMERIAAVGEELALSWEGPREIRLFLAPLSEAAEDAVFPLLVKLRERWRTETSARARNLKTALKHANRFGADLVLLLGEEELASGGVAIKRMDTGAQTIVPLDALLRAIEEEEARLRPPRP
ncbi:MAG: histidine--tRNA ligase [Candidatus Latescibacterota bacterium]|nr:MAG: histidine--tRNA ligase [Candidatus Latescibacterota bacterium]